MAVKQLNHQELHRIIPRKALSFKTTDDIEPLDTVIGQDRALRALQIGLELDAPGYNIFVTGLSGTGRTTIIEGLLDQYAADQPVPDDWCYVFNFDEPESPLAINLPAGRGCDFEKRVNQLINTLEQELNRAFADEGYQQQRNDIVNQLKGKKRDLMAELDDKALKLNLKVQQSPVGFQTIPLKDLQPMPPEVYNALSAAEKRKISKNIQKVEGMINETLRELTHIDGEAQKMLWQLDNDVAAFIVNQHTGALKERFKDHQKVEQFLDALAKDIIDNSDLFITGNNEENDGEDTAARQQALKKFSVNVILDNSRLKGAPVIYEKNPTYNNLFGRIEKIPVSGGYISDFTMIRGGSLLKANGGYLMAEAEAVLQNPFVYSALKRSLRNRELRIEDVSELSGTLSVVSLKPNAIPLKVKVILVGWNRIYHRLNAFDDDFTKIFKIRADFDYETESTPATIAQYAQFIRKVIDEEGLPAFDRPAVESIILYGHRLAENQSKLSLQFSKIVRIVQQAAYWATYNEATVVGAAHVDQAIRELQYRHSLVSDKMSERIRKDTIKINVSGERIGEINALSVYSLGDFAFGKPGRITAKTYIGNANIVNIDRKAGLSGQLHNKGAYILSGFFNSTFGNHIPISFSASLAFEQSYGRIDGDSASTTELYALISSLSGVPIRQSIAVTGSVNQNGDVQAIGGVNEKIEGFFEVCKLRGLTPGQGVMIPSANLEDLLLKQEVRQAVKTGKFNIWAVDTIEDGLEVLTGQTAGVPDKKGNYPADTIYSKVIEKIREFSLRSKSYRHEIDETHKERISNDKKPKDSGKKSTKKTTKKSTGKSSKKPAKKSTGKTAKKR